MGIEMKKGSKKASVNPQFVDQWEKDGWSRVKPVTKKAPKQEKQEKQEGPKS